MSIKGSFLFGQRETSKAKEVNKATGGWHRTMTCKFIGVMRALAFVLLLSLTSVAFPLTAHAAFPGANGKIAFASDRDGDFEIYVMNPDGSGVTQLTFNSALDFAPAWSPDGTQIAFLSDRDGNNEIYVMNADGSGQSRLTNNPSSDFAPQWSPDGTKIVFGSERVGVVPEVYVMNADGSGQTNLTNNPADDQGGNWSPDGTKIMFISNRDGNWELYVMNPDGSSQTRLTTNSWDDADADWSPDGTKIVTMSDRDGNWELYGMNADGTGLTRLTNNLFTDFNPSWSPDGTKIAFTRHQDGNYEIYVMNADGTGQTNLTNNPAGDDSSAWQPLPTITVAIDTTPGSLPNSINPRSKGMIPVAILTTDSFDATMVDPAIVLFGVTGTEAAPVHSALEDVDGDGDIDLILSFNTQNTGIKCGDTSVSLTGKTLGGQMIKGSDSIKTAGCK
jgi:TolB protein